MNDQPISFIDPETHPQHLLMVSSGGPPDAAWSVTIFPDGSLSIVGDIDDVATRFWMAVSGAARRIEGLLSEVHDS